MALQDFFTTGGENFMNPILSKRKDTTVYSFTLSPCLDLSTMLYTKTNANIDNLIPGMPLFIIPRSITMEMDTLLYTIVGDTYNLYAPYYINEKQRLVLDLNRIHTFLSSNKNQHDISNTALGDIYTVEKLEQDSPDIISITMPEPTQTFLIDDTILISSHDSTVSTTARGEITDINDAVFTVAVTLPEALKTSSSCYIQLVTGDIEQGDAYLHPKPPPLDLKFAGIMGHAQPERCVIELGTMSVNTIIQGCTALLMEEETCRSFKSGDSVYMHILLSKEGDIDIHYTPTVQAYLDTPDTIILKTIYIGFFVLSSFGYNSTVGIIDLQFNYSNNTFKLP